MTMRARFQNVRSRGFTMIELMLVVCILGLLTSIAIPEFLNFSIRSKKAERDPAMRNIQSSMVELMSQNEKFPQDLGGGQSQIICNDNPPAPYTGMKKQWVKNQLGWVSLSWEPTGLVYFHYYAFGFASPGLTYFYIQAASDLNGNGIPAFRQTTWMMDVGGNWNITSDVETPPGES